MGPIFIIDSADQNQYAWIQKVPTKEDGAAKPLNRNDQCKEGIIVSRVKNSDMSQVRIGGLRRGIWLLIGPEKSAFTDLSFVSVPLGVVVLLRFAVFSLELGKGIIRIISSKEFLHPVLAPFVFFEKCSQFFDPF